MTYQPVPSTTCLERATYKRTGKLSLWERILGLLEQDLADRRDEKLLVEVQDEPGSSYKKEIEEFSVSDRQSLPQYPKMTAPNGSWSGTWPSKATWTSWRGGALIPRSSKTFSSKDLPALVETDRQKAEEEHRKGRERADFAREARAGLERLHVLKPAEQKMSRARKEVYR